MKKTILILVFAIMCASTFGQEMKFKIVPAPDMLNPNNFSNELNTVLDNGLPMVLNVKFHGVHETDGSDLHGINEERFLRIIASLNIKFNQFNIFFKYRGFNIINDSGYVNNDFSNWVSIVTLSGDYDASAINIMINHQSPYYVFVDGNTSSMTTQVPDANNNYGISPFYDFQPNYIMGSLLSLLPVDFGTSENMNYVTNNIPPCFPPLPYMKKANITTVTTEHVARSGINFNANTAGDMVADTQACFHGFNYNYCDNTFLQHPSVIDQTGVMYACTAVEKHNIMNGAINYGGEPDSFTAGQGARMRQYIISNATLFNPLLNLLEDGSGNSDISVLYEPFAINDGSSNNGNNNTAYSKTYVTNTLNTGANVWNCGPFTMRFQTGFDCEFYPYNASTIPQNPYQHLNHPTTTSISLKIPILGQQIYQNVAPVCFYSFEPFTSGDIKSLINLGQGVYTQEQLDEIKASDPNLYDLLQSGKYHIITKQTDSGFIDQKIIYKN